MTTVLLFRTAEALEDYIVSNSSLKFACVETEWGMKQVVSPSGPTLNHHEVAIRENGGQELPVPCTVENMDDPVDIIAISHLDLDTLGGVLAVQGRKPEGAAFWAAAAHVDVNGPHTIEGSEHEPSHVALASYWGGELRAPRFEDDGPDFIDVTDLVDQSLELVQACIAGTNHADGVAMLESVRNLAETSFVDLIGGVTLRKSDRFTNGLYQHSLCVVGYNTEHGSITLSFAEPANAGVSAADLLVEFFGPKAGGHAGIGGSPKNVKYDFEKAREFAAFVASKL